MKFHDWLSQANESQQCSPFITAAMMSLGSVTFSNLACNGPCLIANDFLLRWSVEESSTWLAKKMIDTIDRTPLFQSVKT